MLKPDDIKVGDRVLLPTCSGEVTWISDDGYTFTLRDDESGEIRWRVVADVRDHYPKEG